MNDLSRVNKAPRVSSGNKVRDFQRKIYQKAKQEPKFRFYSLYDKIYQLNFLREAYARVKRQRGSAGLDGMSFKDIEMAGLHEFLLEIQKDLKDGSYRPSPEKLNPFTLEVRSSEGDIIQYKKGRVSIKSFLFHLFVEKYPKLELLRNH